MDALVSAPMSLYRYFKPMSKSLSDPEGLLSETLASATIEAANEVVLAAGFKTTQGATMHNLNLCTYL